MLSRSIKNRVVSAHRRLTTAYRRFFPLRKEVGVAGFRLKFALDPKAQEALEMRPTERAEFEKRRKVLLEKLRSSSNALEESERLTAADYAIRINARD